MPAAAHTPCMDAIDPELWFREGTVNQYEAKAACRRCPEQLTCLLGAIERDEEFGIWGGQDMNRFRKYPKANRDLIVTLTATETASYQERLAS